MRFSWQILQECSDRAAEIADATPPPFGGACEERPFTDDSSLAYDTLSEYDSSVLSVSDVLDMGSTSEIYDGDEPNEFIGFDQTARSATNSVELIETSEFSTQKRKITAEDEEVERILKGRVSVVLKRIKFDVNMNQWILPVEKFRSLVHGDSEKAKHNEDESSGEDSETDTTTSVIQFHHSFE